MKIVLLNIRFEVSDKSNFGTDISYTANCLWLRAGKFGKASYASVLQESLPLAQTQEECSDLTIADCRGDRKLLDIEVETYNCEDYNIGKLEQCISANSASMSEAVVDRLRSCSPTEGAELSGVGVARAEQSVQAASGTNEKEAETGAKQKEIETGVRPKSQSPTPHGTAALHFFSGNPTVEKVKGILHIYKDNHQISLSEESERSELICMLAVPAKYTIHDLLLFNGPCISGIEYMRIIRDGSPNQYMVLIKFKTQKLADEYFQTYNNTTFNNIESDVCHLVYVGRVETLKESENACFPVPGMTELPNCPVCLERMDESVDGILTILCNHAFHMECLDKWGDTSCPVCRYCQTPEEVSDNRCMKCGSEESLWICLICGNIGCGRYVGLHAYRHFQETQHTYAMELGNNRVWDYVGDNYVHRLIQNKSDGKLVQVDEGGNPVQDEKLDSLNLEYTYLLTNQLESQRQYFEEKIGDIEESLLTKIHLVEEENQTVTEQCSRMECSLEQANKEKALAEKKCANIHLVEEENQTVTEQCSRMECSLEQANKEKALAEKKCANLHARVKKVLHELQEEKTMNKCLLENQAVWQRRVNTLEAQIKDFTTQKDKELNDLREQLRDVMFYVEAQQQLQGAEGISQAEIQEGQVIVGATGTSPQGRRTTRKKPR